MKLITLHRMLVGVGTLSISGSCGQFWVYVAGLSGAFVEAAQLLHQKKSLISCSCTLSVSAPAWIAYRSLPSENTCA